MNEFVRQSAPFDPIGWKPAGAVGKQPMRKGRLPVWLSLAIGTLLLASLSGLATSSSYSCEAMTDSLFTQIGLYSDLVIQGRILRAEIIKVDAGPYIDPVDSHGQSEVIEIMLRVTRVLAGEFGDSTIAVIVPQGWIGYRTFDGHDTGLQKLHPGDGVVACLSYGYTSRDLYVLGYKPFLLRIDGLDLVPYSDEYCVEAKDPIRMLEDAGRKRHLGYIYRGAEIVCFATLVQNDMSAGRVTLKIDHVVKGSMPLKTIELDYRHDFAMWHTVGPKLLLFLNKTDGAYRLSAGMNSVYTVQGERILRNRMPLITTLSKAEQVFTKAGGGDR